MATLAIGELAAGGTAFAVTDELALTAAHAADAEGTDTKISFADGATVPARVASVATDVDLALLELRGPLPAGVAPLRLSDEVASHDAFRALGYPSLPELDREVTQMAIAGEVTEVGTLLDGASTLQLSVREAAAAQPLSLHGMSGGPVLVGKHDLAVGIVRWNPEQEKIAIGAICLATPAAAALARWPDRLAGVFVRPGLERLVRTGLMTAGELPRPSELDLGRLEAVVGPRSWRNGEAPYVERACDAPLDAALEADGNPCVLVTGEPRAGKTRSAIEAVIRNRAEDRVVVPVNWDTVVELLERDRSRPLSAGRLVWFLDDLDRRYLKTGRGVMEPTVDLLLARPGGTTLVATIRSDQLARGLSPEHGLVPEAAQALQRLEERAGQPVVVERLSDPEELQRAAGAYPEEQFTSEVGIAERLGRVAEVRSRYRGETPPLCQALLRAAIDLTRVGRGPTVPSSRLREWFISYVQADWPFDEVSDAAYTEALAWARDPLYPGSSRLALLAPVAGPPDPVYAVEDYLTALDDGITRHPARAIPPLAWELALHDAAPDDTLRVCQSAVARGEWRAAARAGTSISQMGQLGTKWNVRRWVVYAGQAAYGKTRMTEGRARLTRTTRQRGERHGGPACERVGPEQWIYIPVLALIDEDTFALVAERLQRGNRLSPRNTRRPSLLQGILVCAGCGYAYYRSQTTTRQGRVYHYYRCSGTDGSRRLQGQVCGNRPARLEELDELVWSEVLRLLEDPALIQTEIARRLESLRVEHPASHRREGLERELVRARRAVERLIEAYQEELISLDELRARSPTLRKREATVQAELDALDAELHDAESYLKLTETLESFRARLGANAQQLTIEQRQQIVRLLVREVLVGEDQITIRHSIPAPNDHQPASSSLRSGGQRDPYQARPRAQDRHDRRGVDRTAAGVRTAARQSRAAQADP